MEGQANLGIPEATPLSSIVDKLEKNEDITIAFKASCDRGALSALVPRGSYSGGDMKELIENIALRIETQNVRYRVEIIKEGVRYEISCE